jgi:glycosyltransferase involved in cell wall biosynthesis
VPARPLIRYQPEIRSSYIERFDDGPAVRTLYSRAVYLDPDLLAGTQQTYEQAGYGQVLRTVARQVPEVLEVPEPLWTLRMVQTAALCAVAKASALVRGRRTTVVTYCIENVEAERIARLPESLPATLRRAALRPALAAFSVLVDHWVFGTPDSRALYRAVAGPFWRRIGPRSELVWPLPSVCDCPDADRDPSTVVFLGSLERRKGFDRVVAAWRTMDDPALRLTVVGDGPLRDLARQLADDDARVTWLPAASRQEIHRELRRSTALVLPSVPERYWREQIGLPILEGLAHGVTIVAPTDSGVAPWLGEHGHTCVPPTADAHAIAAAVRGALDRPVDSRGDLPPINGRAEAARRMFARPPRRPRRDAVGR